MPEPIDAPVVTFRSELTDSVVRKELERQVAYVATFVARLLNSSGTMRPQTVSSSDDFFTFITKVAQLVDDELGKLTQVGGLDEASNDLALALDSLTRVLALRSNRASLVVGGVDVGGVTESNGGFLMPPLSKNIAPDDPVLWGQAIFRDDVTTTRDSWSLVDQSADSGAGYRLLNAWRGHPLLPASTDYLIGPNGVAHGTYIGERSTANLRFTEIAAALLYGHAGVEERSRTVPMGEWQSFSPSWTSTGTAPSLGNGTLTGSYMLVGETCFFRLLLSPGSTTTFGTGNYRFSLPVTAAGTVMFGFTRMNDSSVGSAYFGTYFLASTTVLATFTNANPVAAVTNTVPFTWADGDFFFVQGHYEI